MSRPRSFAVGTLGQRLVRLLPNVANSLNWPASWRAAQRWLSRTSASAALTIGMFW